MSRRILVVDDEPTIRFALSDYLSLRGYSVDSAADLAEARRLLAQGDYSTVITDLSLSGQGGTEGLTLAAFAKHRARGTRVVILTAYGSEESETAAERLGIDAFLHKPVPLDAVARAVAELP
jgi:DNA-binding response OmpR family regulator